MIETSKPWAYAPRSWEDGCNKHAQWLYKPILEIGQCEIDIYAEYNS